MIFNDWGGGGFGWILVGRGDVGFGWGWCMALYLIDFAKNFFDMHSYI